MFKLILALSVLLLVSFPSVSKTSPKFTAQEILVQHARCRTGLHGEVKGTEAFISLACACLVDQKRVQSFQGPLDNKTLRSCVSWARSKSPRSLNPVFLTHKERLGLSTYTLFFTTYITFRLLPKKMKVRQRLRITMCYANKLLNSGKHAYKEVIKKVGTKSLAACIHEEFFENYLYKRTFR